MNHSHLQAMQVPGSVWESKDPGSGGHISEGSTSLASILATFIPTFTTAVMFLAVFVTIRSSYLKIYAPRTFMGTLSKQSQTPSSRSKGTKWFHDFRELDDKFVLQHQSLDGYLFLRFFKIMILICLGGCCISWPVLFPVNATGGGGQTQLDIIGFGNVNDNTRLYAHVVVAWVFLGGTMLLISRERLTLIGIRQASLFSKRNASSLSSRVVLFTSVPKEALEEDKLTVHFGNEAEKLWPVAKTNELGALVEERNEKAMLLESGEVQLAREANQRRLQKRSNQNGAHELEGGQQTGLVDSKSRPKHRLTMLIGTKVDTIEWTRKTLPDLSAQIDEHREAQKGRDNPDTSSVFVAFRSQAAAQRAYQNLHFGPPLPTQTRYIGMDPKEVLWKNLQLQPSTRATRMLLATVFVVATIILWSIPIGIVGTLSNIGYLTDKVKFLRLIENLPDPALGLIEGLLPPYLMSTFVSYVPKFYRYIAKSAGEPTIPQAELKTQAWYFTFQVIQVFLVTTFTSGAAAVVTQITRDPSQTPTLLASNLPKASNFYLSYFLLQGTASAAQNILNYSDLFEYIIMDKYFDKTPRDKYTRYTKMKGISWGSVYPKFANMAVIAIAYSCISPLVLGFAAAGLYLYYLSYRYNLLYVIQPKVDSKGECYARALQHLTTGVYLSELCLIGLFGARKAAGPSTLMVIFLLATVVAHALFDRIMRPLELYLAVDRDGEEALLLAEEGAEEERNEDPAASHVGRLGLHRLPERMSSPMARYLESYISASRRQARDWLNDPSSGGEREDDPAALTDEEMQTAYLNPALTSKMPKLWLVKDESGVSKHEVAENEAVGIKSTDEGAFLDSGNHVRWQQDDFSKVPIFKVVA